MIQQNELITFLVGLGAALFLFINRHRIRQIPGSKWLFLSYLALFAGWTLTIIEGFALAEVMNALEHIGYLVSSVSAALWCWTVLVKGEGDR